MDTLGAIIGPLIALSLVGVLQLKNIFFIAFIPGAVTVYIAVFLIQDRPRPRGAQLTLVHSIRSLPRGFLRYVQAVEYFWPWKAFRPHLARVARGGRHSTPSYGQVVAQRMGIALYTSSTMFFTPPSPTLLERHYGDRFNKRARFSESAISLFSR